MSKVGSKPIQIPDDVRIEIKGQKIRVTGQKGSLEKEVPQGIILTKKDKTLELSIKENSKRMRSLWGTWRALLANMVEGVKQGFVKELEYEGVGYKAELKDGKLILSLGFSHPVIIEPPPGIEFKTEKKTIRVEGIDKELVGKVAAEIRKKRPPEPYKGKGIRYRGEVIKRKEGKRAVATEL